MTIERHHPGPSLRRRAGLSFLRRPALRRLAGTCGAVLALAGCGGGGIDNPAVVGGKTLSFQFFQECVNPVFLAQLPIPGTALTNTCAAGGCHDNVSGSGGALRLVPGAAKVTVGVTPDATAIHASDMYKNFLSAQGQVLFAEPSQSRLIAKPLVKGVLHGGGRIFADETDPKVQLILYWMSHPAAQGQDEFSTPAPATCPF